MKSVKLDEELQVLAKEDRKMAQPLEEVKLLLAGDGAKDMEILRNLAGGSKLAKREVELGKILDLEKHNMTYGQVFTVSQIEKLARKYKLRFLSSTLFKGDMDIQAVIKLKEFAKEHGEACTDNFTLRTRFFVLAPRQSFNMEVTNLSDIRDEEKEEARAAHAAMLRELDPVLFYKIDDTHFRMIHKWGTDFSVLRKIKGYIWDSIDNYAKVVKPFMFALLATLLLIGNDLLSKVDWNSPVNLQNLNKSLCFMLVNLLCVAIPFVTYFILKSRLTDGNWRPRSEFFSKTNWNSAKMIRV